MIGFNEWTDQEKLIFLRSRYAQAEVEHYKLTIMRDFSEPGVADASYQTHIDAWEDLMTRLQAEIERIEGILSNH